MPADKVPAYTLWIELATRVTTQPLHYRAGDEETAAHSVSTLFQKTRELLMEYPEAEAFRALALALLNVVLRPYTARWRSWMVAGNPGANAAGPGELVFRDELVRRMFRAELRELQQQLVAYKAKLAAMAQIDDAGDTAARHTASLGASIVAGIGGQVEIATSPSVDGTVAAGKINRAEQHEILERRRILAGRAEPAGALVDAAGLALSGGGIRSATFCLGIVQVLVRKNLFPQFDYLSTVSGGGYLGTFLSCALGTNPATPAEPAAAPAGAERTARAIAARIEDVFHRQETGTESGLIRHLRNDSKFLLNGGVAARLRIAGLLASGILWNMLMVLPIPLFAALLVNFLARHGDFWGGALPRPGAGVWPAPGSAITQTLRTLLYATGAALLLLPLVQKAAHGRKPSSPWVAIRRGFQALAVGVAVVTAIAAAVYVQPALFFYYEKLRVILESHGALWRKLSSWAAPAAAGGGSVILGVLATTLAASWPRLKGVAAQLFILSGPVFFLFLYLAFGNRLGLGGSDGTWRPLVMLLGGVALTVWSFWAVNINTLSPHAYYRARLCECYLIRRPAAPAAPAGGTPAPHPARTPLRKLLTGEFAQYRTESLQQVRLTALGEHPAAPYHLINTTLNLPGSDTKELRGRDGDFFLVSKHFCGAPIVGYAATATVEKADPHFDLGTAMAVSAAAASSSMGWKSLPNFRFLMTMLNVRLGYWLRWNSPVAAPGIRYFFQEMRASMDERGGFLNLSDGGHIENLGVYELLRRRCKFIVCVDGGQEPGMECADLTRLQRYAEIDLGIEFEYGIADLSIQANGYSRASAILVKVIYPPTADGQSEALGWMIYLKLALIGIEPPYVLDYRRENPAFPHESTGDQLYNEAQFEAYRRLGECSAENLFREELFGPRAPAAMAEWFQGLADNLLADNDPVFKTPRQAIAAAGASS